MLGHPPLRPEVQLSYAWAASDDDLLSDIPTDHGIQIGVLGWNPSELYDLKKHLKSPLHTTIFRDHLGCFTGLIEPVAVCTGANTLTLPRHAGTRFILSYVSAPICCHSLRR